MPPVLPMVSRISSLMQQKSAPLAVWDFGSQEQVVIVCVTVCNRPRRSNSTHARRLVVKREVNEGGKGDESVALEDVINLTLYDAIL